MLLVSYTTGSPGSQTLFPFVSTYFMWGSLLSSVPLAGAASRNCSLESDERFAPIGTCSGPEKFTCPRTGRRKPVRKVARSVVDNSRMGSSLVRRAGIVPGLHWLIRRKKGGILAVRGLLCYALTLKDSPCTVEPCAQAVGSGHRRSVANSK